MQFIFSRPTHWYGSQNKPTLLHQETSPKLEANLQTKLMSMTECTVQPFQTQITFCTFFITKITASFPASLLICEGSDLCFHGMLYLHCT